MSFEEFSGSSVPADAVSSEIIRSGISRILVVKQAKGNDVSLRRDGDVLLTLGLERDRRSE